MTSKTTDTNKLIQTIRSTKPSNMFFLTVNQIERDSVKKMLKQLESIIGNNDVHLVVLK